LAPHQGGRRFIPACAGNTALAAFRLTSRTVHPRVRGEHGQSHLIGHVDNGSSPRARGTHAERRRGRVLDRFIPACAGNTRAASRGRTGTTVHPRVRGEHGDAGDSVIIIGGSSPRARGTHVSRFVCQPHCRFIPACAGNTSSPLRRWLAISVHPRVRGEHIFWQ